MSDVKVKFGAEDQNLGDTLNKVQRDLRKLETQSKETSQKFQMDFNGMGSVGAKFGAGLAVGLGAIKGALAGIAGTANLIEESVSAASNYGETISKVSQIFGKGSSDIEAWAKNSAQAMGQSSQQAMDAASTFAIFGKSAGLSGKDLTGFSKELAKLSTDLASFHNSTTDEAILAIGSALRGEAEPMRRFGVLLDDATLRNEALKMGLIKTTKEALTPQQKVLSSYALIMNQTKDAQGDFTRTSAGFANQSRLLTANIRDLAVEIGNFLLPTFTKITTAINDYAVPAFRSLMKSFQGAGTGEWATNLLSTMTRVGDVLIGAFRSPMSAIEAINSALNAGVREYGSLFINTYISAFTFIKSIMSSEMPKLISQYVGDALMLAVTKTWQSLSSSLSKVARAFEMDWGTMAAKVITFIYDGLGNAIKLFASDFGQAMTNPIGFITGKLASSLTDAANRGGLTFESSYSGAISTSLEKLSTGLGQTAEEYGMKLRGTAALIGTEFDLIRQNFAPSAENFFGATEATEKMKSDFFSMEESGKKWRESIVATQAEQTKANGKAGELFTLMNASALAAGQISANMDTTATNTERVLEANRKNSSEMDKIKTTGDQIRQAQEEANKPQQTHNDLVKENKATLEGIRNLVPQIGNELEKLSTMDLAKAFGLDIVKKDAQELAKELNNVLNTLSNMPKDFLDVDATKEKLLDLFKTLGDEEITPKIDYAAMADGMKSVAEQMKDVEVEFGIDGDKITNKIKDALEKETFELNVTPKKDGSGKDNSSLIESIKSAVEACRDTLRKIEPKLPQVALGQ